MLEILKLFVSYSISHVTVCCIASISLFCVTLLYVLKPASISTFINHVIGVKHKQKEPDAKNSVTSDTGRPATTLVERSSKSKATREKVKKLEEPVFSSNLSSPIEDIIKETISEDLKTKNIQTSIKKKAPKSTNTTKENNELSKSISDIRKTESIKSEKGTKKKTLSKQKSVTSTEELPIDDVGYSFFTVKEKSKTSKKKVSDDAKDNNLPLELKPKNKDLTKLPTAEHKVKEVKQSVSHKKSAKIGEKVQKVTVNNPSEEKLLVIEQPSTEFKESKKVCSTISYASIVTNTIPDLTTHSEINLDEKIADEQTGTEFINNLAQSINEEGNLNNTDTLAYNVSEIGRFKFKEAIGTTYSGEEVLNDIAYESDYTKDSSNVLDQFTEKIIINSLSKSASSSIEVIYEEQSNIENQPKCYEDISDFGLNNTEQDQSQFEIIEENLNKLVQSTSEIEQFTENHCDSESSSICIIDSQTEVTESDIIKKESFSGSQKYSSYSSLDTFCVIDKLQEDSARAQYTSEIIKENLGKISLEVSHTETFNEEKSEVETGEISILEQAIERASLNCIGSNFRENPSTTTGHTSETARFIEKESAGYSPEFENKQNNYSDITSTETTLGIEIKPKNYISLVFNTNIEVTKNKESDLITEELAFKAANNTSTVVTQEEFVSKESSALTGAILEENNQFEMAAQVRVLTLNNKEHQECTLYRIEKNWIIQFRLGPSLFGRKVYLYCNYPTENKGTLEKFDRSQYQLLNWALDEGCKNADDTATYTQILAKIAGSFHYFFTFEKGDNAERQGSGFFLVDPILKYGNNEDLPLDCIQCQTVLAKGLGSFSTWEKKLQVAKQSGYNMVHFTPIQELGVSNSCYSLSEQLKLNPVFKKENGAMPTFEETKKFIASIRKEWKVTSICDIVLNHTANESEWIKVHPEVTYNCVNCPYMRPAYLLDAAFHQFSMDVKKGLYENKGIPIEVNNEDHLNAIRYHFRTSVLDPLKIEELYICDTSKLAAEFSSLARVTPPVARDYNSDQEELKILQDQEFKRLTSTIDMKLALKLYNIYRTDTFDEESRLKKCTEEFKSKLDSLNQVILQGVNDHLMAAVENVVAGIRYFRVQQDGPRVKEITIKNPLVYRYFTDYGTPKSLKEHEEIMYGSNGRFLMAHNGWVMNSDPLKNFAAADSNIYVRRELIAWGDSVKLRYGEGPKDCPFLWDHMKKYVEQTAEIFDGVRLDNCHSTPIPVAEYLLDCARRVRPDLYVVAELFTNSDMTDNIFVNRLGITSLIREAMSAWDSHEEGRLVYRYGGSPVGSFYQPRVRPLVPSVAHALFLDLTHDNPSPVEKRSVFDLLPSTALVNMACCASGSNRGYDELVPHHIHVVDETRHYTEWTEDENLATGNMRYVTKNTGIIAAKKAINDIHFTLGKEGYNQVYVDQMDPDIVAVTRHRPDTHESYILVAFTAFGHPNEDAGNYQRGIKPLRFEGVLDEIVLEATLSHVSTKTGGSKFARWNFVKDSKWVNGLSEYQATMKQHLQAKDSDIFDKVDSGNPSITQLNFKNFKPGSVVVVKASLPDTMNAAVKSVRTLISQFSLKKETELSHIIDKLTLVDLNRIIYRCDQEERDEGFGFDTYNIPNFESLVYAGLQGFISLLANIRPNNDLGHPMCANLRDGNWMIEYIWKRLKQDVGTKELGQWIEENTKCFNNIPRYLVPSYFDVVVTGIYALTIEQCCKLMSNFVNHGSTFVRGLSLGSVQFGAYIKSADLPVLSPNLAPPKPPTRKNDEGEAVQACVTLSAGLPHFAVGYMRNWGRDTFIAIRGLFILTGRYEEARQHILGYAACLRHGLIPNLLDGGRNSRFNCRDAVWWWMYCIKEYAEEAPNGINILSDKVSRIFPTDDSPAQPPGAADQPLHDVMQEALKVHFQGLTFRERNAGRQIDEHMTDRGFNNQIGIHPETGFVFGGNEWNCGTWMDKMGSSDKAGIRGKPATPRDGSAVELIGLSKAVITWLWKISQKNQYPYVGVERTHKNGGVTKWTFKEWSDKIQANFEKYFWVNSTPVKEEYRPDLIHKRGIYKDCYGATQEWTDFQLRCNFPIAMVVAPELFMPQHAWAALKQAEKYLLGPLGMKTLDPEDWAYHGDYDNSNDSEDPSVAHGFNYHQGPEWLWPVGFFLRAKLHFASLNGALPETLASTKVALSKHFMELQTSVWRGLPELTNSNGSYCNDSSRTQAWSMSCILEVLHDLQKIESNQPVLIN